jgi:hypothetical protein
MKKEKINKKKTLTLSKQTISNLSSTEINEIKAGGFSMNSTTIITIIKTVSMNCPNK